MYSKDISSIIAQLVLAKISICTCIFFFIFDMESVMTFELALALFSVYLLAFAGGYPNKWQTFKFQMAKN